MRLFVRAIRAAAVTKLLDDGECLVLRRRGAEKEGAFQSLSSSHPAVPKLPFPFFLSASVRPRVRFQPENRSCFDR